MISLLKQWRAQVELAYWAYRSRRDFTEWTEPPTIEDQWKPEAPYFSLDLHKHELRFLAYLGHAHALITSGQIWRGIHTLNKAAEYLPGPDDFNLYQSKFRTYMRSRFTLAESTAKDMIEQTKKIRTVHNKLLHLLIAQLLLNKHEILALQLYAERQSQLKSDQATIYGTGSALGIAKALWNIGNLISIEALLLPELANGAYRKDVMVMLLRVYYRLAEWTKLIQLVEAHKDVDFSDKTTALEQIALAYSRLENHDGAITYLETLIKQGALKAETTRALAKAYCKAGKIDRLSVFLEAHEKQWQQTPELLPPRRYFVMCNLEDKWRELSTALPVNRDGDFGLLQDALESADPEHVNDVLRRIRKAES